MKTFLRRWLKRDDDENEIEEEENKKKIDKNK